MEGNRMAEPAEKTAEKEEELEEANEELVESVTASLSKVFSDSSDDEEVDDDDTDDGKQAEDNKEDDDSTPEEDEANDDDADDKQAEEDDDDDDSTPDEDKDETGDKDGSKDESGSEEEVTLSDAYYRAAVHQGWKPEDIKEFFEAKPDLAIKTFAKIHETTNKITSEFARLGRVKPGKEPEAKTATEAIKAKASGGFDLADLKEQYGDDSAVVKAFAAMQGKLDAVVVQPEVDEQQVEELDPVVRGRIEKFFLDPTLKPYADFYGEGKDAAKLTIGQTDNRYKVLETADSIVLGCQQQGREITLEQALESAHLLVSEAVREKALRVELHTKVKKRAKGVSLKPSKSKKILPAKNAKMGEKSMEATVAANLKKTFG